MSKRILVHVLFWVTYVLFKSYLNYSTSEYSDNTLSEFEKFMLSLVPQLFFLPVKISLVYSLFYIIDRYLAGKMSFKKSVILTIAIFIIAIILYIVINHLIVLNWFYDLHFSFAESFILGSISYAFFIISFNAGIAITLKLIRLNLKQKTLSQEIIRQKLETELSLLKSQINPHFLFNTLNNIYGLAIKKSDKTAPIVMKLSKLLRFMLYESDKDRILLSDEVSLIEDYIELEKIRYNERLKLSFSKNISLTDSLITPLILLPLIENAFKHGASESKDDILIDIRINEDNGYLKVQIINSKESSIETVPIIKEKIGIKNTRRQLELTYSDFNFDINDQPELFSVFLTINLNSYGKI